MEGKDLFYGVGIITTFALGLWNLSANKKTAFINTVTSERVKWLEKLRGNISAFCGLTHTWTRGEGQLNTEDELRMLGEIDKLRYLIRLQINPKMDDGKPNFDKQIEDLIAEIPDLTDRSKREALEAAMERLIVTSQALLKAEWEKVKLEAKNGDLDGA